MVRNLVGCLVHVGKGKRQPAWIAEVLQGRDRSTAAPTIGPAGLYLAGVRYAARWSLPEFARMMPFGEPAGSGEDVAATKGGADA
jgi:tRNA pseudouridine38-40 synthase